MFSLLQTNAYTKASRTARVKHGQLGVTLSARVRLLPMAIIAVLIREYSDYLSY